MTVRVLVNVAVLAGAFAATCCGPRVIIATGTTLGLKANPGDVQGGRSPQITLGYKRAEAALVATKGDGANSDGEDAYSTLSSFGFTTAWFGDTELSSFIATGFAARGLMAPDTDAAKAAEVTVPSGQSRPSELSHAGPAGNSFIDALQSATNARQ